MVESWQSVRVGSILPVNHQVSLAAPPPGAATPIRETPTRNFALDGLRGIAVLAVLVYHFWPAALPGGFLGVDLFFVLSGYLITGGLLRSTEAGRFPDLRAFWSRRARRLLPAMVLVLVVSTALALLAAGQLPAGLRWQWAGALTYTSNWMQIAHGNSYFASMEPAYFQHFWSLAVEEQFYLLWPLVLAALAWLLRSRRALMCGILVLAIASAASMAWGFDPSKDSSVLYFGTWTHGFGLLLGSAGAAASASRKPADATAPRRKLMFIQLSQVLMLLAMLGGFFFLPDTSAAAYQGGMALFSLLGTLLILTLMISGTFTRAMLSIKGLCWLGNRSYGVYLWHWPLLLLVQTVFPPQAATAAVLCTIPLVILAAELSWRFVEEPILRYGFKTAVAGWSGRIAERVKRVWNGTTGSFASVLPLLALVLVPACAVSVLLASPEQSQLEQQLTQAQDVLAEQQESARVPESNDATPPGATAHESTNDSRKPARSPRNLTGSDVTALGDSVMLASSQQLLKRLPGISIEASVGAQIWDAPAQLRELKSAGKLRQVVVLGLGTNGDLPAGTLDEVRRILGPKRELLLVTAYAPRQWIGSVNGKLHAAAEADSRTHLVDWAGTAEGIDDIARDKIHPGPHGSAAYGKLLAQAVARL